MGLVAVLLLPPLSPIRPLQFNKNLFIISLFFPRTHKHIIGWLVGRLVGAAAAVKLTHTQPTSQLIELVLFVCVHWMNCAHLVHMISTLLCHWCILWMH